jgi:hypothetical protein
MGQSDPLRQHQAGISKTASRNSLVHALVVAGEGSVAEPDEHERLSKLAVSRTAERGFFAGMLLIGAPRGGSIQMPAVVLRHDDAFTITDYCWRWM